MGLVNPGEERDRKSCRPDPLDRCTVPPPPAGPRLQSLLPAAPYANRPLTPTLGMGFNAAQPARIQISPGDPHFSLIAREISGGAIMGEWSPAPTQYFRSASILHPISYRIEHDLFYGPLLPYILPDFPE